MPERRRSLWAWGWQDKFPDKAARKGLVGVVGASIPGATPVLRGLPSDEPSVPTTAVAMPDAIADFASQAPRERATRTRERAFRPPCSPRPATFATNAACHPKAKVFSGT